LIRPGDKSFVLQAKGDSMIDDGILNGDYVVVKEQQSAYNGDIVVAVLRNGFATLKRFYKEATRIRLQPANSTMSPMYVTDVEIRGKVVAVIRQFN
jgi:repressor LexA